MKPTSERTRPMFENNMSELLIASETCDSEAELEWWF